MVSLLGQVSAVGTIFLFTGDMGLSVLTLMNLSGIVVVELGMFHMMGWQLGVVEAISITILVGLSVDFCLHLAESYAQSPLASRKVRPPKRMKSRLTGIDRKVVSTYEVKKSAHQFTCNPY